MAINYWQHRISHEWDVAKQLFDQGFLTIGWHTLSSGIILQKTKEEGAEGFNYCASECGLAERNRWCLYRFFTMAEGDIVVVPLYEQVFAIIRLSGDAKPIGELPLKALKTLSGREVVLRDVLEYKDDAKIVDLGFFIPFEKESVTIVKRSYASNLLQARMKHQYINVKINDLCREVEKARVAEGPINIHDIILESTAANVLSAIMKLTPKNFEQLVAWYMNRIGATSVYLPASNEPGKADGADADVVAHFNPLGIVFFIQVKKHEGYTDDWAIEQISRYKEQKENVMDDFTYIPWVITTASITEEVKAYAKGMGVRLIEGSDFAKMIMDTGINSINDIMSVKG